MTYRFHKLYADLVTEDGTVCIAYLAQTALFGKAFPHAGLELYWPDGCRELIRGQALKDVHPDRDRLCFDVPGGPFVFDFAVTHGGWSPTSGHAADGLDWSVRFARAQVTARWQGDRSRPCLQGTGYADRVDLRRLPRRFGLQRLDWGRIHWRNRTLVFCTIRFRAGVTWQRAARWSPDGLFETDGPFDLVEADGVMRLELPASTITLRPVRVLHEGPALDPARFPNRLERFFARATAGRVRETRWLSRAETTPAQQEDPGWVLHERVHFQ